MYKLVLLEGFTVSNFKNWPEKRPQKWPENRPQNRPECIELPPRNVSLIENLKSSLSDLDWWTIFSIFKFCATFLASWRPPALTRSLAGGGHAIWRVTYARENAKTSFEKKEESGEEIGPDFKQRFSHTRQEGWEVSSSLITRAMRCLAGSQPMTKKVKTRGSHEVKKVSQNVKH